MLTPEQIAARKGKMTASRIAPLMTGNVDAIMRLYQEMIGELEPEDLSEVWPVRLGETTEALNLEWFERKNNLKLAGRGVFIQSARLEWAGATLDAWCEELVCPVECKHVGGREPLEVVIDRYQPQMQWQMMVTDAEQCALSVIMGANEPIVEFIPRDNDYIGIEIDRAAQFMTFVAHRDPPIVLEPVPPPADASKIYDMTSNNYWSASAIHWLETRQAAHFNDEAAKILKSIVPEDAKKCFGHGVQITRDRAGRLSLREFKD
jgi:predicted phage-related endonuclease